MPQLPNEEDARKKKEEYLREEQAKHPEKIYKCYKCGKTETGENLDNLNINNKYESWYFQTIFGEVTIVIQILPKINIGIVSQANAYCSICGKIRERELELLEIERRKIKASENIGNALDGIGDAIKGVEHELHYFNMHPGHRE